MTRPPVAPEPEGGSTAARPPAGDTGRPPLLDVACALVLLESVALLAVAVAGVRDLVRGAEVGPVLFLVVLALGAALLLAGAVRALWSGRRWGRGPVLTAQIMLVVTAVTWWGAGGGPVALVPVVAALVVVVALLSPRVVAVTSGRSDAVS
ncbi:hypothetical protein [Cellulomonas phragmiteti]|uniref:Histidine kinase n=1 Tax=Cellulomonas phragmiteti TaxID=478780 RepID=A0ABQ4DJR6_9CELL|nr:hypothetical protein [Cellulomonas phragmiteti]GIG39587.1 hypothetical protein Cph01nite_13490 [Cellulomonas phragmiteti]